jgi:hypothetical protein
MAKTTSLAPIKLIGNSYGKYDSIQERLINSYLAFYFYQGDFTKFTRRILPFLGDVSISESRKANYVDYTPISRNSSLPFYVGSESRSFKVTYEISPNFLIQNPGFVNYIKSFQQPVNSGEININADPRKIFFPLKNNTTNAQNFNFSRPNGTQKISKVGVQPQELTEDQLIYAFVDYQVNLIRSSVINNAIDPSKGPPIVRLSHGLLYQNIPCICKDYSIEQIFDDSNRKNFHTKYKVSKHKVQISCNLQEVRTGNYLRTPFSTTDSVAQDNIVGWEQIIGDHKSLDPIDPIYKN